MPELPEVEITARLIGEAAAGARVESALSPGVNALKSYDPPLTALAGRRILAENARTPLHPVEALAQAYGIYPGEEAG